MEKCRQASNDAAGADLLADTGLIAASSEEGHLFQVSGSPLIPRLSLRGGVIVSKTARTTAPSKTWYERRVLNSIQYPCPQAEHLFSLLGTTCVKPSSSSVFYL